MHIPATFTEDNPEILLQIMRDNAFATLVTTDENGLPVATPLPFLIEEKNNKVKLLAHFAKNNPQWHHLERNKTVLVIFNGPHCYVSPSWYKNAGVPTWNYVSVHVYGTAKLIEKDANTAELIEKLSDKYEQTQTNPWKAAGNYSKKMLNAIKGFEITVQDFLGKVKIGQNKSRDDLIGVLNILNNASSEHEQGIAQLIKKHLDSKE